MRTFFGIIFLFVLSSLCSCVTYLDRRQNIEIPILLGYLKPLKSYNEFYFKSNWSQTRDKEHYIPTPYKINLPQNIKWYSVGLLSESIFIFDDKQSIIIIQSYDIKDTISTSFAPTEDDWENLVIKHFDHTTLQHYGLEDFHSFKRRKSILLKRGDITILLYNIKNMEYENFLTLVETFKKTK